MHLLVVVWEWNPLNTVAFSDDGITKNVKVDIKKKKEKWWWCTCNQQGNSKHVWHTNSKTSNSHSKKKIWNRVFKQHNEWGEGMKGHLIELSLFQILLQSVGNSLTRSQIKLIRVICQNKPVCSFVATRSHAQDVINPWQLVCKCKVGIKSFLRSFISPGVIMYISKQVPAYFSDKLFFFLHVAV